MRPQILAAFQEMSPSSASRFAAFEKVMPGGNTRAAAFHAPYPVVIDRGSGHTAIDIDENSYIDLLNNYTSLVHGHAHPAIDEAIRSQLGRGTVFPAPTQLQGGLAEVMCQRFPSVSQVRFVNSGTEAVMMAVRAARAFTGRERIVTIKGGYHGSWDQVASHQETGETSGRPVRLVDRGIPGAVRDLATAIEYNDLGDLESAFDRYGSEIAAFILEPVIGERTISASQEFLEAACSLTRDRGSLLVFDEVVTARLGYGGVQGECGVIPDITAFGKIIGGGLPIGAFGGRSDVMSVFDTRRDDAVPHHGTFNGNSLSMAAGLASLDLLTPDEIERINGLGADLAARLARLFESEGHPFRVSRAGSLLMIHADDAADLVDLHLSALLSGLFMAPRGLMCMSTPMDDLVVDEIADRMTEAFRRLAA